MHHGQRLVLLVYLHLTLEIQYNTILIIINSIYIILLFANKQWGLDAPNKFVYFPMTFSSKALVYLAIEGPGASGTTQTSIGEVYINKMYLRNNGGSNITCTYLVLGK